jgi:hypothetical protein
MPIIEPRHSARSRELVERIVIIAKGAYKGVAIVIRGALAALLEASKGGTIPKPRSMGAPADSRSPISEFFIPSRGAARSARSRNRFAPAA